MNADYQYERSRQNSMTQFSTNKIKQLQIKQIRLSDSCLINMKHSWAVENFRINFASVQAVFIYEFIRIQANRRFFENKKCNLNINLGKIYR